MTDHDAAGGDRPMTDAATLTPRLIAIGDELERATRADLAPARRRRVRRRILGGAAALAILAPGAALAGGLLSTGDVERSLPAGTKFLAGTNPACEVVREGVEYRCTIDRVPHPETPDLKGTVEPTVDATKHVNGGCRSLRSDGTEWRCYIGRAAVEQQIIDAGFLGEYAPSPGSG
jgi:hypothetical protein